MHIMAQNVINNEKIMIIIIYYNIYEYLWLLILIYIYYNMHVMYDFFIWIYLIYAYSESLKEILNWYNKNMGYIASKLVYSIMTVHKHTALSGETPPELLEFTENSLFVRLLMTYTQQIIIIHKNLK